MTKQTTEIDKEKNVSCSWLCGASARAISQAPLVTLICLVRFKSLPNDTLRTIFSYVSLSEQSMLVHLTKNKQHSIFRQDLRAELEEKHLIDVFIHLILEGPPKNQLKIELMLEKHPNLWAKLISTPREMIIHKEIAHLFPNSISAFAVAWWFDDELMCQMLEKSMYASTKDKVQQECKKLALNKFMYLMTQEGQDNQEKAKRLLKQYPDLAATLISAQIKTCDTVRHFLQPLSAYQYLYWAGDTRMCIMLNEYIDRDDTLKKIICDQCQYIDENGVDFEYKALKGQHLLQPTTHSRHFDYTPLLNAYAAYNLVANELLAAGKRGRLYWKAAHQLWLVIGQELAKAPIVVMQEYCSPQAFFPLEHYQTALISQTFVRRVTFKNSESDKDDYLVSFGKVHAGLGTFFALFKAGLREAVDSASGQGSIHDAPAVAALKIRTEEDREQTLAYLRFQSSMLYL